MDHLEPVVTGAEEEKEYEEVEPDVGGHQDVPDKGGEVSVQLRALL